MCNAKPQNKICHMFNFRQKGHRGKFFTGENFPIYGTTSCTLRMKGHAQLQKPPALNRYHPQTVLIYICKVFINNSHGVYSRIYIYGTAHNYKDQTDLSWLE